MARSQRITASSFAQEPTKQIIRVALYARVSTLNNQDPEMQLSELRGIRGAPRLGNRRRIYRPGGIGM